MNHILEVTDSTFQKEILDSSSPAVVDFWAPWCGPCRMLSPILDDTAKKLGDRLKFAKVNTDENQKTAIEYQVLSIPTLLVFKDGKEVDRMIGVMPQKELETRLSKFEER